MMTVHEVSELTGVSIRTLQYYDQIGLLQPAQRTEAGYRLYDDRSFCFVSLHFRWMRSKRFWMHRILTEKRHSTSRLNC